MNQSETTSAAGGGETLDQVAAAYEARVKAVPEAVRRFAEETWGKTWAHAEMGSLLDFAALAAPTAKGGTEEAEALINAARELFGYASYAEIVNGISVNRPQIRRWCDKTIEAIHALEASLYASPPPPAGAAGDERPCQWGGGNDLIWCSTCGEEYAYAKGEQRPPCPRLISKGPLQKQRPEQTAGAAGGGSNDLGALSAGATADPAPNAAASHATNFRTLSVGAPTPDLGAQGEPVAWGRYTVLNADHRRRIQALGAAISLRDWFGVEKVHAEIRDAFDRPDIYDPASTHNLISRNRPLAWAYEYMASDGWQRALWWSNPSELPQYKDRPERCRNIRPLYEAPAAPRTGSRVSVEEIARAVFIANNRVHGGTDETAAQDWIDGVYPEDRQAAFDAAHALLALFAQAPRDGGETQGGWEEGTHR